MKKQTNQYEMNSYSVGSDEDGSDNIENNNEKKTNHVPNWSFSVKINWNEANGSVQNIQSR